MPRFRANFTDNHLAALRAVARLTNATSQAVALSQNMPTRRDYWKRYLNDLEGAGYLVSKIIHGTARAGKSGRKLGTLYALKQEGAEVLAEVINMPPETVFYPRGGIHASSPFQFPHRAEFIELMAAFLGHEKASTQPDGTSLFEVLELVPYFRQEGSNRLGTGRAVTAVNVTGDALGAFKSTRLIPDAVMRFRVGTGDTAKVRLAVIELHRETDTRAVIEQLRKHAAAIDSGVFSRAYDHPTSNYLLSVHLDPARLASVIERIRGGEFPDFQERYSSGYSFATLGDVLDGVGKAFWQMGQKEGMGQMGTILKP
jgi:hypothetical protein